MRADVREVEVAPGPLAHILENLRERDRKEIYALRWDDDVTELHHTMCVMCNPLWRIWTVDGEPAAVFSAVPVRPGVVIVGSFGTEAWNDAMPSIVRHIKGPFAEALRELGVHRAEAYVLADNFDGTRFVRGMDGELEARLVGFGREQEDFLLFGWRVNDVLQRWLVPERHQVSVLLHQGRAACAGRSGPAASGDRPRYWN
jgi:hypothetical protein